MFELMMHLRIPSGAASKTYIFCVCYDRIYDTT